MMRSKTQATHAALALLWEACAEQSEAAAGFWAADREQDALWCRELGNEMRQLAESIEARARANGVFPPADV